MESHREKSEIKTILIVEDDAMNRKMSAKLIAKLGYHVITASNGKEAIEIYRESSSEIDGVILDIHMPLLNGEATFMYMHQINPDIRVIISTGYGKTDEVERLLQVGVRGLLNKPYEYDKLNEALTNLFT